MINLKDCTDKCFARDGDVCDALFVMEHECNNKCKFYKPTGCADWVRIEKGENTWLIPPEELETISLKDYMQQKTNTESKSEQ